VTARAWAAPVDNSARQLDAAAAGAELVELEPLDEAELDFSDDEDDEDEELVDSEPLDEPLDDEPLDELLAASRLSLR
jgi:hypothetical protein